MIPARNEEEIISEAVRAANALRPAEVIVVDGASTDGTMETAKRAGAVVVPSPAGRGTQLDVGANTARGEVILFLHADCRLPVGAREQIDRHFANEERHFAVFRQKINARGIGYRLIERQATLRVRWTGIAYGDQGFVIRTAGLREVGGFPRVPLMEDVILSRRILSRTQRYPALLPGPIAINARRWKTRGLVRQTVQNHALRIAERLGVSTGRLARWYR